MWAYIGKIDAVFSPAEPITVFSTIAARTLGACSSYIPKKPFPSLAPYPPEAGNDLSDAPLALGLRPERHLPPDEAGLQGFSYRFFDGTEFRLPFSK